MKTIQSFVRILCFVPLLFININELEAQKLNIPDGVYFNICDNGNVVVPGDINLGGGTSGVLAMNGLTFKVNGAMNINAGAEFQITQGSLDIASTNYNCNSIATYNGNNQTVLNHDYGNLIFDGTGIMQISGDATTPTTCNNFTVNNTGNSINIAENKAITVNGTVTNNVGNAGIVIASSSSGDGSLIFSTSNISGTVQRKCSGSQWHYISSPLSDAQTSIFPNGYFLYWDATMEWDGLGDYDPWKSYSNEYLTPAQGYGYFSSNDIVSFEGKMNVGNYSRSLYFNSGGDADNQGWNLVGNPFTSAIDWDVAVADGAMPLGTENAIYFFDDDNGSGNQSNYRYYVPSTGGTYGVGTGDATKNIPVGQAFFVKTNSNNVTLNIKNSYRIHNNQAYYKDNRDGIINLSVSGNNYNDETIIRIVKDATLDFDAQYDARKLFANNENIPQIFCLNDDNHNNMAINSIDLPSDNTIIPLGFKAVEGDYKFTLNDFEMYPYDVYLVDNYQHSKIKLSDDFKYYFSHEQVLSDDRFYLIFCSTTNDLQTTSNDIVVYPNPTYGQFSVTGISNNSQITITDVTGKIVKRIETQNYTETIDIQGLTNGLYIINIFSNNTTIVKKIIKK